MGELSPLIFYMDESEAIDKRGKFMSITVAAIPADSVIDFQRRYGARTLWLAKKKGRPSIKGYFPVLHGSKLPEDFSDDEKITSIENLLRSFIEAGGYFARLGFYHEGMYLPDIQVKETRVRTCLNLLLSGDIHDYREFFVVHEMDLRSLARGLDTYSDMVLLQGQILSEGREEEYCPPFGLFAGYFVASSADIGCQTADIASYVALKNQTAKTEFSKRIKAVYMKFEDHFRINKVLRMTWDS